MSANDVLKIACRVIGPMPPYWQVADAVWGKGAEIDSDGDSATPDDTNWRELTLVLRSDRDQRLDIDPLETDRDTVELSATSSELLKRLLGYLRDEGSLRAI
jgi:hypothetical protein